MSFVDQYGSRAVVSGVASGLARRRTAFALGPAQLSTLADEDTFASTIGALQRQLVPTRSPR